MQAACFPTQDGLLSGGTPAIAVRCAHFRDDPVARDEVCDGILRDGPAHCAGSSGCSDVLCYKLVAHKRAKGDRKQRLPDLDLEVRAFEQQVERRRCFPVGAVEEAADERLAGRGAAHERCARPLFLLAGLRLCSLVSGVTNRNAQMPRRVAASRHSPKGVG